MYAEPTIHFFERPVNSGPFPVIRCPLAVVRRFASSRRLARLSRWSPFVPVRRLSPSSINRRLARRFPRPVVCPRWLVGLNFNSFLPSTTEVIVGVHRIYSRLLA